MVSNNNKTKATSIHSDSHYIVTKGSNHQGMKKNGKKRVCLLAFLNNCYDTLMYSTLKFSALRNTFNVSNTESFISTLKISEGLIYRNL